MLFEIVPNLSEGRDAQVVDAAVTAAEAAGARLLHRTSDAIHHRSVLTLAGDGAAVLRAALAIAHVAVERIDLRSHRGVHPRIGALDVLPFVPLRGASLADAAALAHQAGAAIWEQLRVPSFYYGAAAVDAQRTLLADVRRGEFEGLSARFAARERPDVGEALAHPSAGAVAIGARDLLVAFNLELATGDLTHARALARAVRERSGGLQSLRALAFPLDTTRTQVSLNITDARATPLYRVFELICRLARERGISVLRGELIGTLPSEAVESAARYYLGVTEKDRS